MNIKPATFPGAPGAWSAKFQRHFESFSTNPKDIYQSKIFFQGFPRSLITIMTSVSVPRSPCARSATCLVGKWLLMSKKAKFEARHTTPA